MESTKKCFKCGKILPLSEFYSHSQMKDGHLNKCKECTKSDVRGNYLKNSMKEEYMEKQRARGRDKYKRLGYASRVSQHNENKNTSRHLKRCGILKNGNEAHHWSYNERNSVFILSRRAHKFIHKHMHFDKESNMFVVNGVLLDTMEKHFEFISTLLAENKMQFDVSIQIYINSK